jgi:hypothetical protein
MTEQQQLALEQLGHMELVAVCTDGRNLIVRGADGLYYLSPGGLLTRVEPRRG